jgi:S-adenosylmethionine-dependent methyltransferase
MLRSSRKIKNNPIIKKLLFNINVPVHLSENFLGIPDFEMKFKEITENKQSFVDNITKDLYYQKFFISKDDRLDYFRTILVPWLDGIKRLKGLRILEIGCGSGSSTIAFAEQGAIVTAIDINENLLSDAKIRCQLYGLNVRFLLLNAAEIEQVLAQEVFDIIIFMASLEHMTLDERIKSIKSTYDLLPKNGLWCIAGSPNRLHFMDSHTSQIPFFHWLPDQLAIKYAEYSSRDEYRQHIAEISEEKENTIQLYRWGRGISFHEIELALKPLNELKILSNLSSFLKKKNILYGLATKFTANYRYETFLYKLYPNIYKGFFQPYLDIIIEKI